MSRITSTFRRLGKSGDAALIPFVTVGYPSLELTSHILPVIARQGADLIELGVPFSDPLADGATVQRASHAALKGGVTLADCMRVSADARRSNEVPLIFMSYYNPIHRYGLERFATDAVAAGLDGLIVPDLPPEEAGGLKAACDDAKIDLIFLLAPTSTDDRIQRVVEMAGGFIYCVSLVGVTGAREEVAATAGQLVERVRKFTHLPLVVGFGISTPAQVAQVAAIADGVVVGSALVNLIERHPDPDEAILEVSDYIRSLKEACARPQVVHKRERSPG